MSQKVTVSIKDLQRTPNGQYVLVGTPSKSNPKGNYVVNAAQVARLALRSIGEDADATFLALAIRRANGAATLTFEQEACKQGQPWTNTKTGETGVYDKDWVKTSNFELSLGDAVQSELMRIEQEQRVIARINKRVAATVVSTVSQPALGITNDAAETTEGSAAESTTEPVV